MPHPDIVERFGIDISAPAALVFDAACALDMQSLPLVRAIFWLRERLMGTTPTGPRRALGLLAEMRAIGWGILVEEPGRLVVAGAVCQPWKANVTFRAVRADTFAGYAEPDQVRICWTLEVEPRTPALTRFTSETRAQATDAAARHKFRRYWRWARFGIVVIRFLLLPAVRRDAQKRYERALETGAT